MEQSANNSGESDCVQKYRLSPRQQSEERSKNIASDSRQNWVFGGVWDISTVPKGYLVHRHASDARHCIYFYGVDRDL